ncbi:MAG: YggT family protein [Actinobacteria bacterium]|nr:YggT family protein [Actinomycetota bacterium]
MVLRIVCIALTVYYLILIVRIILSFPIFPPTPPSGPLAAAVSFVYAVTDPVLRPLRSVIPPVRMGMMGLDLSPMIVFVLIFVIQRAIGC